MVRTIALYSLLPCLNWPSPESHTFSNFDSSRLEDSFYLYLAIQRKH